MYSRSILLLLLFVYCFCDVSGWKFHNQLRNLLPNSKSLKTSWKQIASISTLLTVSIGTFGSQSVFADTLKQIEPTFDEVSTTYSQTVNIPSLRTQLDSIRKEQILEQKTRVQVRFSFLSLEFISLLLFVGGGTSFSHSCYHLS